MSDLEDKIQLIKEAIDRRKIIKFKYNNKSSETTPSIRLDPFCYGETTNGDKLILGYTNFPNNPHHNNWRIYNLDKIIGDIKLSDKTFNHHDIEGYDNENPFGFIDKNITLSDKFDINDTLSDKVIDSNADSIAPPIEHDIEEIQGSLVEPTEPDNIE